MNDIFRFTSEPSLQQVKCFYSKEVYITLTRTINQSYQRRDGADTAEITDQFREESTMSCITADPEEWGEGNQLL